MHARFLGPIVTCYHQSLPTRQLALRSTNLLCLKNENVQHLPQREWLDCIP